MEDEFLMPTEFEEVMNMNVGVNSSMYEMEPYHRESLNEIKRMLQEESYEDGNTVSEHIMFLEHLLEKLQDIFNSEQKLGETAIHLKRDINEITRLLNALYELKDDFSSAG